VTAIAVGSGVVASASPPELGWTFGGVRALQLCSPLLSPKKSDVFPVLKQCRRMKAGDAHIPVSQDSVALVE